MRYIKVILLLLVFISCRLTNIDNIVMSDDMKNILEKYCGCVLERYYLDNLSNNNNITETKKEYIQEDGQDCVCGIYFSEKPDSIEWNTKNQMNEVIEVNEVIYKGALIKTILFKQKPFGYAPFIIECHHSKYNFRIATSVLLDEKRWNKYVKKRFNIMESYIEWHKKWKNHSSFFIKNIDITYQNRYKESIETAKTIIDYINSRL